jgi:diaminopimelate decarboxylase
MHIGSQIVELSPFTEAVEKLVEVYFELKKLGISLKHFDIGGGFGVKYLDEEPFSPKELAEAIIPVVKDLNCRLDFEPGRYFTANAGILLSEVLYTKQNGDKNFVVIDAAMTDLLRPGLYKAYHHIQPVVIKEREDIIADIVGPVCETGDFLGKKRVISKVKPSESLAVMSSGAYGMVMASNYNARRRAAEILVDDDEYCVIRNRETYDDLIKREIITK